MKKIFFVLIILIAFNFILFSDISTLRLGIYNNPPHTYFEGKQAKGFIVDIINDFANKNNYRVVYIKATFREMFDKMRNKKIDILAPIATNEERKEYMNFTKVPIVSDWSILIIHETSEFNSLEDLNNKTIGVVKGDIYYKRFKEEMEKQDFEFFYREYPHFLDIVKDVSLKEIDSGFIGRFSLLYILKSKNFEAYSLVEERDRYEIKIIPGSTFYIEPLYFGINPDRKKLIKDLNNYLEYELAISNSFLDKTKEKWFKTTLSKVPSFFLFKNYKWIIVFVFFIIALIVFFILFLRKKIKASSYEIRKQKYFFQSLFNEIPMGIVLLDKNHKVVDINKEFQNLFGYNIDELKNKNLDNLLTEGEKRPEARELTTTVLKGERIFKETKRKAKNNRLIDVQIIGAPVVINSVLQGVIGIYIDITEKKKMENEIIKSKNIESLGFLAGGIAHDFNNMLAGILGNISLAKRICERKKICDILNKAEKAALKATGLTQQLLTFSKGGKPVKEVSSIVDIVKDSINFVLSGSSIKSELFVSKKIPPVEVDVTQVTQVINNILINARQVMTDGGELKIKIDRLKPQKTKSLDEDEYIEISIQDSGPGIPENELDNIFVPYYTTKEGGSGLGLSIAYSIIKKHNGEIKVKSKEQKGTTFFIYIPASKKSIKKGKEKTSALTKKIKILLVDDEKIIRDFFKDVIEELKAEVDVAETSRQALDMYKKSLEGDEKYDLVFLDLTIPGDIGGIKTLEKMKALNPDIKAIAISGYSDSEVFSDPNKYEFCDILPKPFKIKELIKVINRNIN